IIPLSIGVIIVFYIYYKSVYSSLQDWEDLSSQYLKANQMQILHNLVYVDKLIIEKHLQKISNDLIVYQGLYYKFINKQVKLQSEGRQYKNCSYVYLAYGKCPEYIYDAFDQGIYSIHVELFFHRTNFTYNSFQPEGQFRLRSNWNFYFFAKSAIYSRRNDLINISLVYNSFNDSLLTSAPGQLTNLSSINYLDCMGNQYKEPYDPRCRGWYQNAMRYPGNQFYKPYQDLFTKTTVMTGSARIDDPQGNNLSVISVDFLIINLINQLFVEQDKNTINNNFDTHSVLFHEDQNTVYYHRYWNANDRTIAAWQDLEFNKTYGPYTENEFNNFVRQVQETKDYSLQGQYNIGSLVNITSFYQFWTKNNKPYVSLIYPIEIVSPQNVWNKTMIKKQVLMVGKIMEDQEGIFKVLNLTHDSNYAIILSVQVGVIVFIIIILVLHYAAILKYQILIPIEQLKVFIIQNTDQFKYQKASQNKKSEQNELEIKVEKKINLKLTKKENSKNEKIDNSTLKIDKSTNNFNNQSFENKHMQNSNYLLIRDDLKQDLTPSGSLNISSIPKTISNAEKRFSNFNNRQSAHSKFHAKYFEELSSTQNKTENENMIQKNENNFQEIINQRLNLESQNQNELLQYKKIIDSSLTASRSRITTIQSRIPSQEKFNLQSDLEPKFLEMQTIKEAFYQLQSVISFKKSDIQYYSQMTNIDEGIDEGRCILHYAFAYKIFRQLKNNFGIALSSLNLGYFCYKKSDFTQAISYYELAMMHCIIQLGFPNVHAFIDQQKKGFIQLNIKEEAQNQKIVIICVSLILQSVSIKEVILDRKDLQLNQDIFENFLQSNLMKKIWLDQAKLYIEIGTQLVNQLKKLNQQIFTDEIMMIIQTNYVEILLYGEQIEKAENLLLNLQKKMITLQKGQKNKNSEFYLNQFLGEISKSPANQQEILNFSFNQEVNNQDLDQDFDKIPSILEGKLEYLFGFIHQMKKNYKNACMHYVQCLEDYYYLEITVQKKILENLSKIFLKSGLSIKNLKKEINIMDQKQIKKVYDIAIIVEGTVGISLEFKDYISPFLLEMYQKFIREKDRITFIAFQDKNKSIIQPLLPINKFKQWKFCIEEIPKFSYQLAQNNYISFDLQSSNMSLFPRDSAKTLMPRDLVKTPLKKSSQQGNQLTLFKKDSKTNKNNRKTLYIIFANSQNNNLNPQQMVKDLTRNQNKLNSKYIYVQLIKDQNLKEDQQIYKNIQQDQPFLHLKDIQQLQYFIDFNKRSENSQFYLTNLLFSQSNL
ncbi:hypothetical protein ABPG74_017907, partial [Tetrahymena malaccensis]